MRRQTVRRLERTTLILALLLMAASAWLAWQIVSPTGFTLPWQDPNAIPSPRYVRAMDGKRIGIIAGHMNNDSGAVCPDGLQETQVNQAVARLVIARLEAAGATVDLLGEKDVRLNGYRADALLSIHADSCIDLSGFKAARSLQSQKPLIEDKFLRCVYAEYGRISRLPQHLSSISHNMTEYYAFNRIDPATPAVILETGFLGGDRQVLTGQQDRLAWGISESIICFFKT